MISAFKAFPSPFYYHYPFLICKLQEKRGIHSSVQNIMRKKGKAPSSEDKEMMPLYTDTTCNRDADVTTWEGMHSLLKEENIRVMEVTATAYSCGSFEASITKLAYLFLH